MLKTIRIIKYLDDLILFNSKVRSVGDYSFPYSPKKKSAAKFLVGKTNSEKVVSLFTKKFSTKYRYDWIIIIKDTAI